MGVARFGKVLVRRLPELPDPALRLCSRVFISILQGATYVVCSYWWQPRELLWGILKKYCSHWKRTAGLLYWGNNVLSPYRNSHSEAMASEVGKLMTDMDSGWSCMMSCGSHVIQCPSLLDQYYGVTWWSHSFIARVHNWGRLSNRRNTVWKVTSSISMLRTLHVQLNGTTITFQTGSY